MTSQSNEDKIYASLIIDSSHYQNLFSGCLGTYITCLCSNI